MTEQAQAYPCLRVRIKANSKLFPGVKAVVAYVGDGGVSVYLVDHAFDDCVPLDNNEWEVDDGQNG